MHDACVHHVACVYDPYMYDALLNPWPRSLYLWCVYPSSSTLDTMHVTMMHVFVILVTMTHVCMMRVWLRHKCMIHVCMMQERVMLVRMFAWCMYTWCVYTWCMYSAYIYDDLCINLWCRVFSLQTKGQINKSIIGVHRDSRICNSDAWTYDVCIY